jgi:ADP-dependent NAD(P)H-hydrate dehydratase / NAD(P)H-hydrate epimerase
MIPVVTPDEMRRLDAAASEPVEVLIARAGDAVAGAALDMLGGTYGRTVHVIAGPGNNGADGRHAGAVLARRGVRVVMHDAASCPTVLPRADLVIDAAYGTGFRGRWAAPAVGGTPVLAVDVPSGLDALTGATDGPVLRATRTVTFAALKPGHLTPAGRQWCGTLDLVDIGLDMGSVRAHLVEAADVRGWLPARPSDAHKWDAAVRVVGGSPGMSGAPALVCSAAMRAGAGMVHLSVPGPPIAGAPLEVVQHPIPLVGWAQPVLDSCWSSAREWGATMRRPPASAT